MTDDNVDPGVDPGADSGADSGADPGAGPEQGPADRGHSFGDAAAEMANETEVEGTAAAQSAADELAVTRMALEERTLDLQRVQAEYANYRKRVDRDRDLVRENATFAVLTPIIDVLDTIDRAREHGELDGGFKVVAEQLERVVANLGLTRFGEPGDEFDPTLHEALSHVGTDPEVTVVTCKHVAKAGYKIGERVVRAAQVLVVDPPEPADAAPEQPVG